MYEKKKILVICQSAVGQMYFGVLLNRIGYMPVFSRTAGESLWLARENVLSLIVFDGNLDDRDRSAAVSLLRSENSVKLLPLVVILASEDEKLYDLLINEGCAAVVSKPLDVTLVYGILGRLSGEPRQTPRIPVSMRVEIEEQIPDRFLTSVNMSETGIYLRTHKPVPENTLLHISFTLPHDFDRIEVLVEVVRKIPLGVQFDAEPGIGLRFVEIPEYTKNKIKNFVKWTLTNDLEWELELADHQ